MTLALLNLALVIIGYAIAYREGRWNHEQLGNKSIPYLNHGGMWADLIILTIVAGYIDPYKYVWTQDQILTCLSISLAISIIAHIIWSKHQTIPGHIIEPSKKGLLKMPWGGWYHLVYMTIALATVLLFYIYTPEAPKHHVSVWLSAFVIPTTIFVGGYIWKKSHPMRHYNPRGDIIIIIIFWAIIWLVGYTEILSQGG